MEHIFNIAINVEDERIVSMIEKNVETQVVGMITAKVEDIITSRYYYNTDKYAPLKNMIVSLVDRVITENKDLIIAMASEKIAEKLARSKDGKAILSTYKEG